MEQQLNAVYKDLADKHIFITGGASGIGAEMVRAFSAQGARVSFIDFDSGSATKLCADIASKGSETPWFREVDVTDVPALEKSIEDAAAEFGPIYALINNVANDTRHSPEELDEEGWRKSMAVNLDPVFFASKAAYKSMSKNNGGSIINLSSITALLGLADLSGYITAKAAIIGMTKALATDYGEARVRVNAILPGWVITERQLDKWLTPEAEEEWKKLVALKDRVMPVDVAKLAL
ncbi:MAG: SDR family oxidoreductase, partial [Kordiimonadaceae bacterium]|nr:SDR family oxidoreductase [Kordiimonadaceae bacterium]